jgi:hypothetical protein
MAELDADIAVVTPTQIQELVARKALPLQAITTLDVTAAAAGAPSGTESAQALAACVDGTEMLDAA